MILEGLQHHSCGWCIHSVGCLKREVLESKYKATKTTDDSRTNRRHPNGLCLGTDLDLLVINAQTREEYVDDSALIPHNTSILLRRVPGNRRRKPIDTTSIVPEPRAQPMEEKSFASGSFGSGSSVVTKIGEENDVSGDDFGGDVFAIPDTALVQLNKPSAVAVGGKEEEDEDSKIRTFISTPPLYYYDSDISSQAIGGFRRMSGRGFGGLEGKTPPEGYVCHMCNVPGHFIQHCPTNGDPKHDFRRVRPPTSIPKSMLVVNPDGSYKLPEGACAVIKPNEDAFDQEMEGLFPSSPLTLYCPSCKQVMKDAMVTSKCCFQSFCDKCIRDWLINSKLKCVCGTSNILTNYLLPNITLRDAIKCILESGSCSSSGDNVTSAFRVQERESAGYQKENVPAPLQSAASTKEGKRSSPAVGNSDHIAKKLKSTEASDASETQIGSVHVKEPALGKDVPAIREAVQPQAASSETGKQRRKKKASQGEAAESYMMPIDSCAYDSHWNVMQPWMQVYMAPYANTLPYNAYGMNSYGVPFFNAPSYMPPSKDF